MRPPLYHCCAVQTRRVGQKLLYNVNISALWGVMARRWGAQSMACGTTELAVLFALWLFVSPVLADGAAKYGQGFVRAGQTWTDGRPAATVAQGIASDADAKAHRSQIEKLEVSGGPYNSALAEPLGSLARFYQQNGNAEQAQHMYRRALHVVRVNDGLDSERQRPIVSALLSSYRGGGDLEALDQQYDYYFRLFGSGQAPYSELRLSAALEYMRWQREAYRLSIDDSGNQRLLSLLKMNRELLRGVAADPAVHYTLYQQLAISQLRNLYLLQADIKPQLDTLGLGKTSQFYGTEPGNMDFNRQRLEALQRNAIARGRDVFGRLLERIPANDWQTLAQLRLELGDWLQWNDMQRQAQEHYVAVSQILQQAGASDLEQQWLGQPIELPDNGAFWQSLLMSGERKVAVEASYDVSERGKASNIRLSVSKEEDRPFAYRLKRKLSETRFRPRYVNGLPTAAAQISRRYDVLH